jgi:hypothetical protein
VKLRLLSFKLVFLAFSEGWLGRVISGVSVGTSETGGLKRKEANGQTT